MDAAAPQPFATDDFSTPALSARRILSRPRLIALLDGVLDHPVTIVHAPAGCGKTVAMASWCARREMRAAWVRLDAADVSEQRFLAHLAAAVESLLRAPDAPRHDLPSPTSALGDLPAWNGGPLYVNEPAPAPAWSAPAPASAPSDEAFSLLDSLLARMGAAGEPLVLVFDNWHVLQQQPRAGLYLGWMLDRLPENVRLAVLGRVFPHVGAMRHGLRGELLDVGLEQLLFTRLETEAFCQMEGMQLEDAELEAVLAATAGWPMALRLLDRARKTVRPDAPPSELWRAFDRGAYDYLYDEMLIHLPEALQTFLTVVACLEEFNDALAAHVLQWDVGEADRCISALLDYAAIDQVRVDAEGRACYAAAPVVRRALYGRGVVRTSYRYKDVMCRAAAWYEMRGDFGRAVDGYAAARDFDAAAQVVYRNWRSAFANDDLPVLAEWIGRLPADYVENHPKFCIISALPAMVEGRREEAFERLRWAGLALSSDGDGLTGLFHAVSALCLAYTDIDASCAEARRALETLEAGEDHLHAMMIQVIASGMTFDDPAQARAGYEEALAQLAGTGLRNPLCSVHANLAFICAGAGAGSAACDHAGKALGLYDPAEHERRPMLVSAYAARALARSLQGDDGAWDDLAFAREHIGGNDLPANRAAIQMLSAIRARKLGDAAAQAQAAHAAFSAAPDWVLRLYPPLTALADWRQAGAFTAQEARRAIAAHADSPAGKLALMTIRFAAGSPAARDASVAFRLASAFEAFPLAAVRAGILAAALETRAGNGRGAQDALARAFAAAEPEGIVAPFLADAPLIEEAWRGLARADRNGFAARVLRDLPPAGPARSADELRGLLSERELEVVRLAAQGLNNQQVAEHLFVSRETTKKHLANVYAKLGVHTRTQAAAALRQAGLL